MAANNFSACLAFVLKYEGGEANVPGDPGGRTNEGITQRTYDGWRRGRGLPTQDVYRMPDSERDAIYKGKYWDVIHGDALAPGVDLALFDVAVNSGPGRAMIFYGKAINAGSLPSGRIKSICSQRLSFMHRLGKLWVRFGKGWSTRVNACQALALQMASKAVD